MSLFHRKRLAHQLVASQDKHNQIGYSCSVCTRTFHSATSAKENGEYCCGKRCYTERNLSPRIDDSEVIPAWLMQKDEIKATGRALRKHQEPIAYLHYELVSRMDGGFTGYYALFDIRECIALDGAIPLPELA